MSTFTRLRTLTVGLLGLTGAMAIGASGAGAASPATAWQQLTTAYPALADLPASVTANDAKGTVAADADSPDNVVRLGPRERREIVVSTAPLKVHGPDGTVRAVDVRLQTDGSSGTMSPAVAPFTLELARAASAGWTIGPDAEHALHVTPLGVDPAAVHAPVGSGQAFAVGTRRASDTLQRPLATGLETFELLRGPEAPESFSYRLDLKPGQTAELTDQVLVVRQGGRAIVTVPAPVSLDADQRPVATTATLQGDVLTVSVAHRVPGVAYPVLSDPEWDSNYDWSQRPGVGSEGWGLDEANTNRDFYDAFVLIEPPAGGTPRDPSGRSDQTGLFVRPKGGRVYPENVGGRLAYLAPGTTSIASVDFKDVTTVNDRDRQVGRLALYSGDGKTLDIDDYFNAEDDRTGAEIPLTATDENGKFAIVAMFTPPCRADENAECPRAVPADNLSIMRVGSTDIHLVDNEAPTAAASGALRGLAGTWSNLTGVRNLTLALTDPGSGVERWELISTDEAGDHALRMSGPLCDADHNQPGQGSNICPFSQTVPLNLDTSGLPEGENRFRLSASDYAKSSSDEANQSDVWSVYIDRTKPAVTPAGPLYTGRDTWIDPSQIDATVRLAATDARSGVKQDRLTATDDKGKAVLDRTTNTCDRVGDIRSPCPSNFPHDLRLDADSLPEGILALSAQSTDYAGNASDPFAWRVLLDRTPPIARAAGDLVALQDQWTNTTGNATVDIDGRDELSGVDRLDLVARNADGRQVVGSVDVCPNSAKNPADGSCPHRPTGKVTVDVGELPDGQTSYEVQAHDLAGHTSRIGDTWDTYIDHTAPPTPGGINVTSDTPTTAEIRWNPVVDVPEGTEGVSYEYLVTANGNAVTQWTATKYPFAKVEGLPPGLDVKVLIRALDQAGNVSPEGFGEGALQRVKLQSMPAPALPSECMVTSKFSRGGVPYDVFRFQSPNARVRVAAATKCPNGASEVRLVFGKVCLAWSASNSGGAAWKQIGSCKEFRKKDGFPHAIGTFQENCRREMDGPVYFRLQGMLTKLNRAGQSSESKKPSAGYRVDCPSHRKRVENQAELWKTLSQTKADPTTGNPIAPKLTTAASTLLRRYLGDPPTDIERGWAAHHLVPTGSRFAVVGRAIAYACRVHPNLAGNGLYLRRSRLRAGTQAYDNLSNDLKKRALHRDTLTAAHYRAVNEAMLEIGRTDGGCTVDNRRAAFAHIKNKLADKLRDGIVPSGTRG